MLICLFLFGFGIYYIFDITWSERNNFSSNLSESLPAVTPKLPEEKYTIEITTGNFFTAKIGDVIPVPVVFQLSEEHKKDLTPYVLYVAYLDGRAWQQIHSEYLSGDVTEKLLQIETGTLDLPPGSYYFVVGLFSSENFATGASLAEIGFELTLIENEDNPNEPYTIAGKIYDKDSTELILRGINNRGFKKLSNFENLIYLHVESDELTDISPIVEMENLKKLFLFSTSLENIEPLRDMRNLTHLGLGGIHSDGLGSSGDLYDISPISNLTNLESLTIKDCQVSDISAVKNLSNLKMLWVYKTKISNLTPVSNLINLTDLRVHYNRIEDISCLENLKELEFLAVSYNYFPPEQVDKIKENIPNCEIVNN